MKHFKQFSFVGLSLFLLTIFPMAAQTTLPAMPTGGPDNSTFDKPNRFPAGTQNHTSFYSAVAGKNVDIWIYTPPGYTTSQKYAVVYCYQGIGVDAGSIFYSWCVNAGIVCDNLIGEKKISKGVIIVALDDQFNGNSSNVRDMTIKDAIPYIDSRYSTYADADHRGVFGYSWGGGYTFNVGCENLDYFHYISPSSPAPSKHGDATLFPNGGAKAKQVMKLLFLSWGSYDYQSIIDASVASETFCKTNNIPLTKWVAVGQGHTAGTWRPALWNFLQMADRIGISGNIYDDGTPKATSACVTDANPNQIQVTMSKSIVKLTSYSGFSVKIDNQVATIDNVVLADTNQLVISLNSSILKSNTILLSYANGTVVSVKSKKLGNFTDMTVDNLIKGAAPKVVGVKTTKDGDSIVAKFNMKMQCPLDISALTLRTTYNGGMNIPISKVSFLNNDSTSLIFALDKKVYADYKLLLSYSGSNISSSDNGLLKTFVDFLVTNYSKGLPVKISSGRIESDGMSGAFVFSKALSIAVDKSAFSLKVNRTSYTFKDFYCINNTIRFTLPNNVHPGDTIKVSYTPGKVIAADLGVLEAFSNFSITNQVLLPTWISVPGKVEAENFYSQSGVQTETTADVGVGLNLGYIDTGDWFEYGLNNNTLNTSYNISFRLASNSADGKFDYYLDNNKIAQVVVPNTGGFQTWQSVVKNITIPSGKHYLKIVAVNGGFNVNYYEISKVTTGIESVSDDIIKIYPNPVLKEMIISSTDFRYNKVDIIDITGKTVFSKLTAQEPDLHVQVNLPKGLYVVKISNEKQYQLKRIIIDNN